MFVYYPFSYYLPRWTLFLGNFRTKFYMHLSFPHCVLHSPRWILHVWHKRPTNSTTVQVMTFLAKLLLHYFITSLSLSLSLLLTHVTPTVMRSVSTYIYIQIRVGVKQGINMQIWQWFTAEGALAFLCLLTAGSRVKTWAIAEEKGRNWSRLVLKWRRESLHSQDRNCIASEINSFHLEGLNS